METNSNELKTQSKNNNKDKRNFIIKTEVTDFLTNKKLFIRQETRLNLKPYVLHQYIRELHELQKHLSETSQMQIYANIVEELKELGITMSLDNVIRIIRTQYNRQIKKCIEI
jgi:hypothetical protein